MFVFLLQDIRVKEVEDVSVLFEAGCNVRGSETWLLGFVLTTTNYN